MFNCSRQINILSMFNPMKYIFFISTVQEVMNQMIRKQNVPLVG